jgi:hypothetical protein
MGVTQQEIQEVPNLRHDVVYKRIKEYYSDFIKK